MKTKIIALKINGMTCPSCSSAVEKLTADLPGIKSKTINHATDSGIFEFDETVISEQEIIAKINEGHYKVDGREQIVVKTKNDAPPCPACGKTGQKVFNSVFKSNVKPESFSKIDLNGSNYICFNSDCEIAYYDEADLRINQSELKRPLWFKKLLRKKSFVIVIILINCK
jgi:copper chaperone CopZ